MRRALPLALVLSGGCLSGGWRPVTVGEGRLGLLARDAGSPVDFSVSRHPGGAPYRLSDDRGAVVLLDVWATWCDPCRESLPFYDELARRFAERGLKVYAVSVDADAAVIAPFVSELKLTLPVLHDPEAAMAGSVLQVRQMPTSLLIDRQGVVRRVHEGLSDDGFQQTVAEVEALLAEPAK